MNTHCVYRAYDYSDRLLYVGCTKHPALRLAQHRTRSDWFDFTDRITISQPRLEAEALAIEAAAIATEGPWFNVPKSDQGLMTRSSAFRTRVICHLIDQHNLSWDEIRARGEQSMRERYPDRPDREWRLNRYLAAVAHGATA